MSVIVLTVNYIAIGKYQFNITVILHTIWG